MPEKLEMCQYGNSTYQAGEKFRPDSCTVCHCPRHGGRALCTIQDCLWEPHCLRRHKKADECCGSCLEQGCLHSDGRVYPLGATVLETICERCVCPTEGGPTTCTQKFVCPEIHCVDPVTDPASCCPSCPNGICFRSYLANYLFYMSVCLSLSVCLFVCLQYMSICLTMSVSMCMSECFAVSAFMGD